MVARNEKGRGGHVFRVGVPKYSKYVVDGLGFNTFELLFQISLPADVRGLE